MSNLWDPISRLLDQFAITPQILDGPVVNQSCLAIRDDNILRVGVSLAQSPYIETCAHHLDSWHRFGATSECNRPGILPEILSVAFRLANVTYCLASMPLMTDGDVDVTKMESLEGNGTTWTNGSTVRRQRTDNMSWTGYLGELFEGRVDMLVGPISPTQLRRNHFKFIRNLFADHTVIVGPKILAPSIVERTLLLARMFKWELWLMVMATALALAVGTTYMRHSKYIGVSLIARVVIRDDGVPRMSAGVRLLTLLVAFCALLFMNLYKATLLSTLILPQIPPQAPSNPEQLARTLRSSLKLKLGVGYNGAVYTSLMQAEPPHELQSLARFVGEYPHLLHDTTGMSAFEIGVMAMRGQMYTVTTQEFAFNTAVQTLCNVFIKVVEWPENIPEVAIPIRLDYNAQISSRLNDSITQFQSAIPKMLERYYPNSYSRHHHPMCAEIEQDEEFSTLGFDEFLGLLLSYMTLSMAAATTVLFEWIYYVSYDKTLLPDANLSLAL